MFSKMAEKGDSLKEMDQLESVVLESAAQFNALHKLYQTNTSYKGCAQDPNRVGSLDCSILLADLKQMRALNFSLRDENQREKRFQLLQEALKQVDSVERVCVSFFSFLFSDAPFDNCDNLA